MTVLDDANIEGYILPFDEKGVLWAKISDEEDIFLVLFSDEKKLSESPLNYTHFKIIQDEDDFLIWLSEIKFLFRIALDPETDGDIVRYVELHFTTVNSIH